MKSIFLTTAVLLGFISLTSLGQTNTPTNREVPPKEMEKVFDEIKTPFKYGIVIQHPVSTKMVDTPTVFREYNVWYMTYIVFDGKGYETRLSESDDLLHWESKGKILSFT